MPVIVSETGSEKEVNSKVGIFRTVLRRSITVFGDKFLLNIRRNRYV